MYSFGIYCHSYDTNLLADYNENHDRLVGNRTAISKLIPTARMLN